MAWAGRRRCVNAPKARSETARIPRWRPRPYRPPDETVRPRSLAARTPLATAMAARWHRARDRPARRRDLRVCRTRPVVEGRASAGGRAPRLGAPRARDDRRLLP